MSYDQEPHFSFVIPRDGLKAIIAMTSGWGERDKSEITPELMELRSGGRRMGLVPTGNTASQEHVSVFVVGGNGEELKKNIGIFRENLGEVAII